MAAYPVDNHALMSSEQGSSVLPVWEPRVNGVPCRVQRQIREAISGLLGVPHSWTAPAGRGLPQYWLRTAFPWTWRWRLRRTAQPLTLKIEAFVICSIPTRRWSFALRQRIRHRFQAHREEWTEETGEAWTASEKDTFHKQPKAFGWKGEGPALHPSEGQGGAPVSLMLRSPDLFWEALAASHYKTWVRMEGTFALVDFDECMWLSDSISKREAKDEERARRKAERAQLPGNWTLFYWEGFNERLRQGVPEWMAHREEALSWGEGWVRQPGDLNRYGIEGCAVCTHDAKCVMCAYAEGRRTTSDQLVTTSWAWLEAEDTTAWGDQAYEIRQMVRHGLLDHVDDPDAVATEDREAQGDDQAMDNGAHAPGSDARLGGSAAHANAEFVVMGGDDAAANAGMDARDMTDGMIVDGEESHNDDDYISIGDTHPDDRGDDPRSSDDGWHMVMRGP